MSCGCGKLYACAYDYQHACVDDSVGIQILNLSCNPLLPSWEVVASITQQLPKLASLDLRCVQKNIISFCLFLHEWLPFHLNSLVRTSCFVHLQFQAILCPPSAPWGHYTSTEWTLSGNRWATLSKIQATSDRDHRCACSTICMYIRIDYQL